MIAKPFTYHKLTIFFILFAVCFSQNLFGQTPKQNKPTTLTILIDHDYYPYSVLHEGAVSGLLVDIISAVDQTIPEYNIELKAMKWRKARSLVKKGQYMAIAGTFFHAHDWKHLYPYSLALYSEKMGMVCAENVKLPNQPEWPEDYANLKIGTVAGYDGWAGAVLINNPYSKVNFFEFPSVTYALKGAHKGVVDCTLMETVSFDTINAKLLANNSYGNETAPGNSLRLIDVLSFNPVYVGYSETAMETGNYPFAKDFQKKFDIALFTLKQSGALESLFVKYNVPFD